MTTYAQLREFPYVPTRQGGQSFRASFTIKCCDCGRDETIDSASKLPDQVIRKKFAQKGWQLGRGHHRDADHCPECMGVKPENKLAEAFRVVKDGQEVPSTEEVLSQKREEADRKVSDVIRAFREPDKKPTPPQAIPAPSSQVNLTLDLTPLFALLTRIAEGVERVGDELREVRAASELNMEMTQKVSDSIEGFRDSLASTVSTLPAPLPLSHEAPVTPTPGSIPIPFSQVGRYLYFESTNNGTARFDRHFFMGRIKTREVVVGSPEEGVISFREYHGYLGPREKKKKPAINGVSAAVNIGVNARVKSVGRNPVIELVDGGFNLRVGSS